MKLHSKKHLLLLLILCMILPCILTACNKKTEAIPASDIASVDDLAGKTMGVQIGTTGDIYSTDEYENDGKGSKIERYSKSSDAVQALKQGKIDCVIIDSEPANSFVEKNTDLSILPDDFALEDYAICIAKGNSALKDQINKVLEELKSDGTLAQIISNYIGDDTKGKSPYTSPDDTSYTNGKLVVATNAAFKPYEYRENGEIIGIDMDLARAIADRLSMELDIQDMEFDSIITAVSSGKANIGVAGMTVTEDRLKNIDFTDSYTTARQVIIVRNGTSASEDTLKDAFYRDFIKDGRYKYLLNGLRNTLIITLFASILGIVLGFLIALVRSAHDKTGSLKILNFLCKVYLTIIRGTPTMIQLLIIYYCVFASVNVNKILVAIIAFGINSAAYVAEIFRSGIMSIDNGQFEAGRSMGFTFAQTMIYVILPQAFKNVLPALGNEFIVLLKETSISGYIALEDLTKGGDIIRSTTYDALLPLLVVALIYLVIVMILTAGVNKLERKLKVNER